MTEVYVGVAVFVAVFVIWTLRVRRKKRGGSGGGSGPFNRRK